MAASSKWVRALVVLAGLAALGGLRHWTAQWLAARRAADAAAAAPTSANLYAEITRQYNRSPSAFASRAAEQMARTIRHSPEFARVTVDDRATVMDVGPTLRVGIEYSGPMPVDDRLFRTINGEVREYFHARGLDIIRASCFVGPGGPCTERASYLAQAERALLDRLGDIGPVGILPDGGRCEASRRDVVGAGVHTMTCVYGGQLEMQISRLADRDVRRLASMLIEDPALRDSLEGRR